MGNKAVNLDAIRVVEFHPGGKSGEPGVNVRFDLNDNENLRGQEWVDAFAELVGPDHGQAGQGKP